MSLSGLRSCSAARRLRGRFLSTTQADCQRVSRGMFGKIEGLNKMHAKLIKCERVLWGLVAYVSVKLYLESREIDKLEARVKC